MGNDNETDDDDFLFDNDNNNEEKEESVWIKKTQYDALKKEIVLLKCENAHLRDLMINGKPPSLQNIEFAKNIDIIRTKKLNDICEYARNNKKIKPIILLSKLYGRDDKTAYKSVETFYELNNYKECQENPFIFKKKKQKDVLQCRLITNKDNVHCKKLYGEKGVFAKENIPIYTVIGEYFGAEYLQKEWNDIYYDTNEQIIREKYSFGKEGFYVDIYGNKDWNEKYTKNKKKKVDIWIDALSLECDVNNIKSMVSYINSASNDLFRDDDIDGEKRRNIDFIAIKLKGWFKIVCLTVKDIKKKEQVLGLYGNEYKKIMVGEQNVSHSKQLFGSSPLKPISI